MDGNAARSAAGFAAACFEGNAVGSAGGVAPPSFEGNVVGSAGGVVLRSLIGTTLLAAVLVALLVGAAAGQDGPDAPARVGVAAVGGDGLLVLGGVEAVAVAGAVEWLHGPVHAEPVGPPGATGALDRGMRALVQRGAVRVVVVPVQRTGDAMPTPGRHDRGGVAVLVLPPVLPDASPDGRRHGRAGVVADTRPSPDAPPGGSSSHDLRRTVDRVERRATAGLLVLRGAAPWPDAPVHRLSALNVTATRTPLEQFGTAAPVSVVESAALDVAGADPLEPLAALPGVELSGVGQARRQPVVRGFTGQRVLLLEDGLRLSNSRRRLDSVEPASLVGPHTLERIEVVRGPASVLYGSDAIGGVVNLVTRKPASTPEEGPVGVVRTSGSTAGNVGSLAADLAGSVGAARFRVGAGLREAGAYRAPGGRFGDVRLPGDVRVHDTGVTDRHVRVQTLLGDEAHHAFLRAELYEAEEGGFGYVDPELLDGDPTRVRITFPTHRYRRLVAGWRSAGVPLPGVHAVDVAVYLQDNDRDFVTDVSTPLGSGPGGDAWLNVLSTSRTGLTTVGARSEITTRLGDHHLLTWGVDAYRERARGTDSTVTTIHGMGPPTPRAREDTAVPDATLHSVGAFAQGRWTPARSTDVTAGVRFQEVRARPDPIGGAGEDGPSSACTDACRAHTDRTLVGSVGVVHRPHERVALVGSVARGFRSPNLVERFYAGPSPGGQGLWIRNPGLSAETSLNVDLGARLRAGPLEAEVFGYRTVLQDGILLEPTGRDVDGMPEYRNENVDELVVRGVEAWLSWAPRPDLGLVGSLDVRDDPASVEGGGSTDGGVRTAGTVALRFEALPSRLALAWEMEWQGAYRAFPDAATGPVGRTLPAYQVHDLRSVVTVGKATHLALGIENVFDRLHAAASNIRLFRPEPGRALVASLAVRF